MAEIILAVTDAASIVQTRGAISVYELSADKCYMTLVADGTAGELTIDRLVLGLECHSDNIRVIQTWIELTDSLLADKSRDNIGNIRDMKRKLQKLEKLFMQ